MKHSLTGGLAAFLLLTGTALQAAPPMTTDGPRLTLYNQNFAVARQTIHLDLKPGVNQITYNDITYHLEPDSVILRDLTGKHSLQILEQNYRADPITQELLLNTYEGKTIDFQVTEPGQPKRIVRGKIIRSGYVPHYSAFAQYGQNYQYTQSNYAYSVGGSGQPIVEVDGKTQFGLPGQPLFPALPDDTLLKPSLDWSLQSDSGGAVDAELAYVTGGMSWKADYNITAPPPGDLVDVIGWVTMDNQSGKTFSNAHIKLMAGDVSKIQGGVNFVGRADFSAAFRNSGGFSPPVTEKTFDEYHLYTLERPTTLRDRETKQVEFIHATGVKSATVYVYDGTSIPNQYQGWNEDSIRGNQSYGTESNPKVWIMREIVNSQANGLGIPLPKGRVRFYRRDTDQQLEFTGENTIDHTPKDETLRVYTGNAFDLTGERKQTDWKSDYGHRIIDETFSITLRNHKKTPVTMHVVEHLYRSINWDITAHSDEFTKKDSRTIEFRPTLAPDEEKKITYTAHYSW